VGVIPCRLPHGPHYEYDLEFGLVQDADAASDDSVILGKKNMHRTVLMASGRQTILRYRGLSTKRCDICTGRAVLS
jgi:hypothetical protein